MQASDHARLASQLKAQGRTAEAKQSWRAALALDPHMAEGYINLGNLLKHEGDLAQAEQCYRAALQRAPELALAHGNLGAVLQDLGRHAEAQACYEQALARDPALAEVYSNLGDSLRALGQPEQAAARYRQALQLRPALAPVHLRLVQVLQAAGRHDEVLAALDAALVVLPGEANLHAARGYALLRLGRPAPACGALRRALELNPNHADAHLNLGGAHFALGQPAAACDSFQQALRVQPAQPLGWTNLGAAQRELGQPVAAEASLRQALAYDPACAPALNNLGLVLADRHALVEAEDCLRRAVQSDPAYADAWGNLAAVLESQGRMPEAQQCRRHACQLKPDDAVALSSLLFSMHYLAELAPQDYLAAARQYGQMVSAAPQYRAWRCAPAPQRLRVGVVTADLWRHPVGYFLESVLAELDPQRIELIAYRTGQRSDDLSERIKPYFSAWKSLVGLDDQAAAAMIEADGVHLLLDLAGHTAGNRLPVFARKPAPVQASWLGYFASTGVAQIDYVLTDPVSAGQDGSAHFSETLWPLPATRLCFSAPHDAPAVAPLPALANGFLTFGCFQNLSKVTDGVLAAWARILHALPTARLRLQCRQLGDPVLASRLQQRLRVAGIDLDRVQLHGPLPRLAYLAAHAEVDILLDTFPYPGGTTTCEALWMGVPTVTLAGRTMMERQGASLLSAAGLAQWIAADPARYVTLAVAAGADLGALAGLRDGMRARVAASPLCDAARFARALEAAWWEMWSRAYPAAPDAEQMNQAAALFNQRRFAEGEQLARALCARFPQHPFGWNLLGLTLRNLQRAPQAEQCYRRALALTPGDAQLLSNLAVCQIEQGQFEAARASCAAALLADAGLMGAHVNLGNACKALGELAQAAASYRSALALAPDNVDALGNLAGVACEQGLLDEACACAERAVALAPHAAGLHNTLAIVYQRQRRHAQALACYRDALALQPALFDAHANLANLMREQGKLAAAEQAWRDALQHHPGSAPALRGLATSQRDQGRLDDAEASLRLLLTHDPAHACALAELGHVLASQGRLAEGEASCRQALLHQPALASAHNVLGAVLRQLRRLDEAAASLEQALRLQPELVSAHNNLGAVRSEQGRWTEAEASYRAAIALQADCAPALVNLGAALMSQARFAEAEACQRAALAFQPDDAQARDSLLFSLNFNPDQSAAVRFREAVRYGELASARAGAPFAQWLCAPAPARLRVGLVSGDLRHHPVGHFLADVVRALDKQRIELFVYNTDHRYDQLSERLRLHCASWKSVQGLSDEAAARLIHADGVHILLDLAGHTAKNRLPVFAWRPAPLQAAWLGYFATTGMAEIDYLLADRYGVPADQHAWFTEKIWYLPHTRLCFTPTAQAGAPGPLPALERGYLTFGSFQVLTKVSDAVLARWARILAALPTARLRLQCRQLADPAIRADLTQRLARHAIDSGRVELHGPAEYVDYLAAHAQVDVILDTFPFPGGTTTCEALWMGVPTLTLAGASLLERQGASLLMAAGLPDWVAASEQEYVDKAIALGSDIARLAALRQCLRAQVAASPVFDAPRFARDLADALHALWQDGGAGRLA